MYKCIFCLKAFPDDKKSEEHIFPDSIGGSFNIYNICVDCNRRIGHEVDAHLINHFIIQSLRMILKIKGKSGNVPNPIENGFLAEDKTQRIKYIIEEGIPKDLYHVPKVEKSIYGKGERIKITVDVKDENKIQKIFDKIIERYKNQGRKVKIEDFTKTEHIIKKPQIEQTVAIDLFHYHKGMLKIIYELACYYFGDEYLNDPIGTLLRNCILDKDFDYFDKYPLRGKIDINENILDFPFKENFHYGIIMPYDNYTMCCYVRIFSAFEALIIVTEDKKLYNPHLAKIIECDPIQLTNREYMLHEFINRN